MEMIKGAREAARAVGKGEKIDDAQWTNYYAVLAGTIPEWEEHGAEAGPVKECVKAVAAGQDGAVDAIRAWKKAARPGLEFERQRRTNSGLMHLVLRLWRERIEHDAPGLSVSEERWRVRKPRQHKARQQRKAPARRSRRRPTPTTAVETENTKFAQKMNSDQEWKRVRGGMVWSPWGNTSEKTSTGEEDEEEQAQRNAWRLRGQCLSLASYYRVMHSHARAQERQRMQKARDRFQRWAVSFLKHRKDMDVREAREATAESERGRRGDRVSSGTRMEHKSKDIYRDGVRYYKPRAPQHAINKHILNKKQCRTQITNAAEIGPRLYENYKVIALRCAQERMMRDDG